MSKDLDLEGYIVCKYEYKFLTSCRNVNFITLIKYTYRHNKSYHNVKGGHKFKDKNKTKNQLYWHTTPKPCFM